MLTRLHVSAVGLIAVLCAFPGLQVHGSDHLPWPERAGPTLNGHASPEESSNLPVEWDEASGKNIAWKIELPGHGLSTPVIGLGKLYLTFATEDGAEQSVLCLNPKTGETIHKKLLFENAEPEPLGNKVNTYASPSCVLEPDALYVHFGSYGTARLNPETLEVVWERRDIRCRHYRGPGSSPVIYENLLFLTFDGIDQQFLMALDKRTGKTVWRTDRTTEYDDLDASGKPRGDGDYRKAFSTPTLVDVGGKMQLLSTGSRAAFGYDALTGHEIWTLTHLGHNATARPMMYHGHALINTGSGQAKLVCVDLTSETKGNIDKTHVLWTRDKGNSDLSSPILIDNRVYMVTGNGIVSCVNADNGEEVWKQRIGGTFVSAPVTANGVIYFSNEEGVTTVVRAGDRFEEIASNKLDEGMRSSPAIADGAIFLRTFGHLYKISAATK